MKPKKRQKLCHHCEGEVDLDVIVCPFCAADLREEKPDQLRFNAPITRVKHVTEDSLYPPAHPEQTEEQPVLNEEVAEIKPGLKEKTSFAIDSPLVSILAVALGAQFLFLTLAFLFLSHRGVLLLQFNANYWPLCLFLSIPLLIFGYRSIKN